MPLTAAALASWSLPQSLPTGPMATAARELALHLKARGAPADAPPGRIELSAGEGATDGFIVEAGADILRLHGFGPRGCLDAAYWLLERLGYCWVEAGESGTRFIPGHSLAEGQYSDAPAFARRTLILGNDAFHDDWRDWLTWASRNRLNDLFLHDTPPGRIDRPPGPRPTEAEALVADGAGWMFERWAADGEAIRTAANEAGMTIQFGGHHLPTLLPRALFEAHPEWFPVRHGQRDGRYNLCVSNEAGVAHLRERAGEFFSRFAGARVYHLWADDIRGGGWCECPGCAAMTPSDQALHVTNVLAAVLAAQDPQARIAHLAYHDTLLPPTSVRPRANVSLLFAPRERCYAHAINDPACERNVPQYWAPFTALAALFENDAPRIDVFEYYSDAVLFRWLAPPHLAVTPTDCEAYAAAGAGNLQNLMVSPRRWLGPPWHAWWMARCAWDPASKLDQALARFCAAAYPGCSEEMADLFREQEAAYSPLLDLHDLAPAPRRDVLDFSSEPRVSMRQKVAELAEASARFEALFARCASIGAPEGERRQAELVWHVAAHIAQRMAAWEASLEPEYATSSMGQRGGHVAQARSHLQWLEAWESSSNSPAFANLSRRMLASMSYFTRSLE
ncbi:MAG: DUF4838 domain-containing protein [Tepidiformaceae bacterium]